MFKLAYFVLTLLNIYAHADISSISKSTSSTSNVTIPFEYPLYGQCDETWDEDIMDTKTICAVGCLMSSTSMGLAGTNIPIPIDKVNDNIKYFNSTPRTLNQWLKHNDGYGM